MSKPTPPIPAPAPPPSVAISVDGRIAENKLCVDCSYNLRGLKPDGRCPECGNEVAASLRGHELLAASLPWLREVCRGFVLMKKVIIISLLGLLVAIAVEMIWGFFKSSAPITYRTFYTAFRILLIAMGVLLLYSFFLATRVEPRIAAVGEGLSPRRCARALVVFALAAWMLLKLIEALASGAGWVDQFVIWAPLVIAVAAPLAAAAFVTHVIALLQRTADEKAQKSAKQTRQITNVAIVLAALILVVNALAPILKNAGEVGQRLTDISGTAAGCNSCVMVLFAIGFLELVWRSSRIMRQTLAAAEQAAP